MGKSRVHAQVIEVIEISRPAGALVDFLQRHDIRRQPVEQPCNPPEIRPQFSRRGEPLDWIQTATMRDVECDAAQAWHIEPRNKDAPPKTGK